VLRHNQAQCEFELGEFGKEHYNNCQSTGWHGAVNRQGVMATSQRDNVQMALQQPNSVVLGLDASVNKVGSYRVQALHTGENLKRIDLQRLNVDTIDLNDGQCMKINGEGVSRVARDRD